LFNYEADVGGDNARVLLLLLLLLLLLRLLLLLPLLCFHC